MKKILYASLIAVLIILSMGSMEVAAQPVGEWISNIYCVNQANTDGEISLKFYDAGTLKHTIPPTIIAAGKAKYFLPGDLGALGSFAGSLVIESSTGLSCSVQTSSKATGTQANPFMYGASGGFDQNLAAPVMYVPQAMNKYFSGVFGTYNSYVAIQNTSASKITVKVEFRDRTTGAIPTATKEYDIEGRSNVLLYLHENATLPAQFLGTVKVSAKDGVTPIVVQSAYYNDSTHYTKAQFALYNGAPTGENKLYAPYIMRNFYDYNAGFNVVNVGTTPTSFKIEFTIGRFTTNNYTYQHPTALPPGGVVAFFTPDIAVLDPVDGLPLQERAGSAIIYAANTDGTLNPTGQLIANINFRNDGRYPPNPNFGGAAATYNAVGSEYAGKKLFIPNIQNKVGGAIFTSGINVANLQNTAGSCTYKFVDAPAVTYTQPIPANGIFTVLVSNIGALPAGYNSAAIIECNVDVIAIITSRADASGYWGDSTTAINALKP